MVPVQCKKLNSSQRETQTKPAMLLKVSASARWPEYVSTRQRRYGLRHGAQTMAASCVPQKAQRC